MRDSSGSHQLQPARLLGPWNSPGKNTRVDFPANLSCSWIRLLYLNLFLWPPSLIPNFQLSKQRQLGLFFMVSGFEECSPFFSCVIPFLFLLFLHFKGCENCIAHSVLSSGASLIIFLLSFTCCA